MGQSCYFSDSTIRIPADVAARYKAEHDEPLDEAMERHDVWLSYNETDGSYAVTGNDDNVVDPGSLAQLAPYVPAGQTLTYECFGEYCRLYFDGSAMSYHAASERLEYIPDVLSDAEIIDDINHLLNRLAALRAERKRRYAQPIAVNRETA